MKDVINYMLILFVFLVGCSNDTNRSNSETVLIGKGLKTHQSNIGKTNWAFSESLSCDLKYDTIKNEAYKWHLFILTERHTPNNGKHVFREGKKINNSLYPKDIFMFINSLDKNETEIYKILTNKVIFYILENETKILEHGFDWKTKDSNIDYFMEHVEHPICNSLPTDSIISLFEVAIGETKEEDKEVINRVLKRLKKASNKK